MGLALTGSVLAAPPTVTAADFVNPIDSPRGMAFVKHGTRFSTKKCKGLRGSQCAGQVQIDGLSCAFHALEHDLAGRPARHGSSRHRRVAQAHFTVQRTTGECSRRVDANRLKHGRNTAWAWRLARRCAGLAIGSMDRSPSAA
jgi:hypothetical protein